MTEGEEKPRLDFSLIMTEKTLAEKEEEEAARKLGEMGTSQEITGDQANTQETMQVLHLCKTLNFNRFKSKIFFFLSPPVQVARWAHMHHILSVVCRLSVCLDLTEIGENNSYLGNY